MLQDLDHNFGGDLSVTLTGDLATVSGDTRTQQRILRRLLTNPGGYIAQPTYGAGLLQFIGQAVSVDEITALIKGQIAMEASVAQTPAPVITVTQDPGNVSAFDVSIAYTDATSNQPTVLSFTVSQPAAS